MARGTGTIARQSTYFIFAVLTASCAFAQPAITPGGVVNSPSYLSPGLPGSEIAQGSIFSIFGTALGPKSIVQTGPLPLQKLLAGTSVTVTVGGQTVSAYMLMAVSYQVNALLPSSTPTGSGTVTVTYDNQTSAPEPIQIVNASFATYTFNSGGVGQAIATDQFYNVNTIINTLHPNDYVILWGTGLGPINGDDSIAPPVGNLGNPTVHIGNLSLTPYYAGRSYSYPGLDQVIFEIPAGIEGCSVPVAVETNGLVGGSATIAVSASGQTCSDSLLGQDLVNKLAAGGTVDFGFVQLYDIVLAGQELPVGLFLGDFVSATFSEFTPPTAGLASYGVSQGYCLTGTFDADMSPAQLDAGAAITVQGPSGTATIPAEYSGWGDYFLWITNGAQFYWSKLAYTVSSPGGARVGQFSAADITQAPAANFSGIRAGQALSLSSDLTVNWTGGDPNLQNGRVTIVAVSETNDNLTGAFMCTAPVSAQSFTIPKWVLSTLPPTGTGYIGIAPYPTGYIWIGQLNSPVTFQAKGLDKGILVDQYNNGFPVYFQ